MVTEATIIVVIHHDILAVQYHSPLSTKANMAASNEIKVTISVKVLREQLIKATAEVPSRNARIRTKCFQIIREKLEPLAKPPRPKASQTRQMQEKTVVKATNIHGQGLFTLKPVTKCSIIFTEKPFLPDAPIPTSPKDSLLPLIQWFSQINYFNKSHQSFNPTKSNSFYALSHLKKGPILKKTTQFIASTRSKLAKGSPQPSPTLSKTTKTKKQKKSTDHNLTPREIALLHKSLLIDATNAFDQGTYTLICRINHSCESNTLISPKGSVISLRSIHKNEELTWKADKIATI